MKEFFKPTRKKILFTVIFFVIEFAVFFLYSLVNSFSTSCPLYLGSAPSDAYQNPHSLSEAWQLANAPDCGYPWPGIYSPLVKTIHYTQIMVVLLLPYLLSCIFCSYTGKLKKKKHSYLASSKK
jgi:hypothetical protein